jgi:hypothetical protein
MKKNLFSMHVKRESTFYLQKNGLLEHPENHSMSLRYKPIIPLLLNQGELQMVLENGKLYLYFSSEETKGMYKIGEYVEDYFVERVEGELFEIGRMDLGGDYFPGEFFSSKDLRAINIFCFIFSKWNSTVYKSLGDIVELQDLFYSDTDDFVQKIDRIIDDDYSGGLSSGGFFILECKTRGVLKIDEYVRKHEIEPPFFDLYNIDNRRTTEMHIRDLEAALEALIIYGQLDGFVDTIQHEYRDRAMVVQEHTVIQYNVQLDFNQLVQQLGNKGVDLTSIQCSQCGAPCSIPGEGSFTKCEACGSIIKVTDIFEKFKNLLS